MFSFLILALVASVTAEVMVDSHCPAVTPVQNFDFPTYGDGVWYEVARYPNTAEREAECGWTEYTFEEKETKVKNYHVFNNELKVIEGTHKPVPGAGKSGKVLVSLPYGDGGAIVDNVFNVLDIKYDEYLIGYYCKYDSSKKVHQDFAWVLSRTKVLSPPAKAAVNKYLKESKVLDSSKFVWPSFSDEDCRIDQ